MDADRRLTAGAGIFLAANLLHSADHLRRGWGRPLLGETPEVLAGGLLITLGAVLALALAARRSGWAPILATAAGFTSAAAVAAAHVAPPWGVLSDSYLVLRPDVIAWVVVLVEIAAALGLGAAGLSGLRPAAHGPTTEEVVR
jgi:hypothetical protein